MTFLPSDYKEVPQAEGGKYMKLQQGDNVIRILSPVTMGWLDWKEEDGKKTPIRTPYGEPKPKPLNQARPVKHFWAFVIYDYADGQIKIMEITQSTIQNAILHLHHDEDWGSPTEYDIKINRKGESLDTEYQVSPKPKKPISEEVKVKLSLTNIDLNKLFTNENPFLELNETKDEIDPSEIPF